MNDPQVTDDLCEGTLCVTEFGVMETRFTWTSAGWCYLPNNIYALVVIVHRQEDCRTCLLPDGSMAEIYTAHLRIPRREHGDRATAG